MNVQNLCQVFENFKKDKNRAILVDGPWGVGKTYQILQFLKNDSSKKKKRNKIIYVTLFGKTTIDEIHTDIYSKLNPFKTKLRKAVQVIPKVAPLFGTFGNIVSNMEFALNANEQKGDVIGKNIEKAAQNVKTIADNINEASENKTTIKKSKNKTIVILDDLERIDSEKMPFGDILGYINNLFLQNIKVIVICNSKEIKDKDFISFKEKVFDREYKISSTNSQIIATYFGEYAGFLKDYIAEEFNNNLRIALRVSNFYKEVIKQLNEYNKKYYEKISNETILFYCALVVTGCNSQKYADVQDKPDAKKHVLFISSDDENIQEIAQNICNYLENTNDSIHILDSLIIGLLEGFYYNTYDRLAPLFVDTNNQENPFMQDPFCLSDDEKIELFTKQFEKMKSEPVIAVRNINNVIEAMCRYENFSDINNREDEIIANLIAKGDGKGLCYIIDRPFGGCERFISFSNKLKVAREKNQIEMMVQTINRAYKNKKYTVLYDSLCELARNPVFTENKTLRNKVLDTIKFNNFFIEDLFGSIDSSQWDVALKICDISLYFGFADDIIAYIKTIDCKNDYSAKKRYDILLRDMLKCEI